MQLPKSARQGSSSGEGEKARKITADLLIPGRGQPVQDAALIWQGSRICYAGPAASLPSRYQQLETYLSVPVLMPGLWDAHVHYFGTHRYSAGEVYTTSSAVSGARIARSLVATLNAGYTSVRELGGYGCEIASVVNEGWIPGPKIYSAVAILSQTGGHGDARAIPLCDLKADSEGRRQIPLRICDGVDECVKAVREMHRRGAKVIKIATSGGASTDGDDLQVQQFSKAEIAAIVDEATRTQLVVAAHAHGTSGIKAALLGGCSTIEHASFLDDAAIDLMKQKNAIMVVTRGTVEFAIRNPDFWTPEQYAKVKELYEASARSYQKAVQAGVKFALGSDLVVSSSSSDWVHGDNGAELKYAVEAGMTPLQAIEAATANGPDTLGLQAPKSGWLREGYDADMVSLNLDPLHDIGLLASADNVINVWKDGKHVKTEGHPIGILT